VYGVDTRARRRLRVERPPADEERLDDVADWANAVLALLQDEIYRRPD